MHFPTVALIGRYQDTGLATPLRALAHALTQAGRQVLVDADTARKVFRLIDALDARFALK